MCLFSLDNPTPQHQKAGLLVQPAVAKNTIHRAYLTQADTRDLGNRRYCLRQSNEKTGDYRSSTLATRARPPIHRPCETHTEPLDRTRILKEHTTQNIHNVSPGRSIGAGNRPANHKYAVQRTDAQSLFEQPFPQSRSITQQLLPTSTFAFRRPSPSAYVDKPIPRPFHPACFTASRFTRQDGVSKEAGFSHCRGAL